MILTAAVLTLFLAKALGVYMLAAGLSGLVSRTRWTAILDGLKQSPALCYITGVFVFALGVAMIIAHTIWTDPLAIVVSLFGWAAAIEGLILIVAPEPLLKFGASLVRPGGVVPFALFAIIAGIVLLLCGLIGRAGF